MGGLGHSSVGLVDLRRFVHRCDDGSAGGHLVDGAHRVVQWNDIIGNKAAWNVLVWFATLVTLAGG